MAKNFLIPRGTADILPAFIPHWHDLEQKSRRILEIYGFREIRTPVFEETALFVRSLGDATDVVQKQMLTIAGGKEDNLSLRPEGTAAIVRSYIENDIDKKQGLAKFYYIGAMFRGERPQKGRLRQFHQIGVEAMGPTASLLDAEVIALAAHLLAECGISGYKLRINSLGTPEDKKKFSGHLRENLRKQLPSLCEDCQSRFERNVFRILDCKQEGCKKIVHGLELGHSHLSEESREYFEKVKEALTWLNVPYEQDYFLVRGLDYYTHTVFEISHPGLGSQDAIGAGGRYNNLIGELGGPQVGAVGFALGMERMLLAKPQTEQPLEQGVEVFVVSRGEACVKEAVDLLNRLRHNGVSSDMSYEQDASFKSQLRLADKFKAKYVIFIGEDELKENSGTLKDMTTGTQEKVPLNTIVEVLKSKLC